MTGRALARLVGLVVLWQAVNLLERVAYAAGVDDAAHAVVDEDQADELEPFDLTDVVWAHIVTVHGSRGGECTC